MSNVTRRSLFAAGGIAAAGIATAGGWFVFHKHQLHGPYGDILAQIPDRDAAVRVGQAVLRTTPHFETKAVADRLRTRPLTEAMSDDAANGSLVEIGGWVVPESFALACGLAAKTA